VLLLLLVLLVVTSAMHRRCVPAWFPATPALQSSLPACLPACLPARPPSPRPSVRVCVAGTLASCSWDHSVRMWDAVTGANLDTLNHNKALYCVAAAPRASGGSGLVAFGGAGRALGVWDCRVRSGEGLAVKACSSHTGWISALAWHPSSGEAADMCWALSACGHVLRVCFGSACVRRPTGGRGTLCLDRCEPA
jgi:hypothetical protein